MTTPYTYLIGWTDRSIWYYGVRYAKDCHPDELLKTYFTSSKYVKNDIDSYGVPDHYEIRRTFSSEEEARNWEHRVLRRINAVHREDFLNETDNKAIKPKPGIKRPGIGGVKKGTASKIKGKMACHDPLTLKTKYVDDYSQMPNGYVQGGPPKSKEHNIKNSLSNKGRKKHSDEQRAKWSKERSGKNTYGDNPRSKKVVIENKEYNSIKHACESLNKNSDQIRYYIKNGCFKPHKISCEHCGKSCSAGNYSRWHGDNCKYKS